MKPSYETTNKIKNFVHIVHSNGTAALLTEINFVPLFLSTVSYTYQGHISTRISIVTLQPVRCKAYMPQIYCVPVIRYVNFQRNQLVNIKTTSQERNVYPIQYRKVLSNWFFIQIPLYYNVFAFNLPWSSINQNHLRLYLKNVWATFCKMKKLLVGIFYIQQIST